jgi:hypothetical protein
VFERGEAPIWLTARGEMDTVFVLGSAVPHPHELHLGTYSVHASAEALARGEWRIAELGKKLAEVGDRWTNRARRWCFDRLRRQYCRPSTSRGNADRPVAFVNMAVLSERREAHQGNRHEAIW